MAKQYEPPKKTGYEYVQAAQHFSAYTISSCMKLPERWSNFLLIPLADSARNISDLVVKANGIYLNEAKQDPNTALQVYKERLSLLYETYRGFRVFDANFEQLMDYIDLSINEKRRLKNAIEALIHEAQKEGSDTKELTIRIISHFSDMEYQSAGGVKMMKLKLTTKSRDEWLRTEAEAKKMILNRIHADQKAISRLEQKLQPVHQV